MAHGVVGAKQDIVGSNPAKGEKKQLKAVTLCDGIFK